MKMEQTVFRKVGI